MSGSKNGTMNEESVKITRLRHMPWQYRVQPFLTPWLIMLAVFIASGITRVTCKGPVALVALTLMAPGLGIVTWLTWGRRHEHARVAATAFVVGMGLWLALATAVGPLNQTMIYTGILGGAFLCLTWNIRYAGITPTNKHDGVKTGPVDSISEVKGLKNTVTGKVKRLADKAGERVEIILNHPKGKNTTADVRKRKDNIAGLHSVSPEAVRVSEVPGRGDQTRVIIRPDNPTTDIVEYEGPSRPGQSITAGPLRTGKREDGADSGHWITGNDQESRAASATLYTGMTGSGKTEAFILAMLEMITRTDCAPPVVADPEKFMLSFGHVMDVFDLCTDSPEGTAQLVSNLPEALRYRAALLGSLGFHKGWVPEAYLKHGIPVQPIHVEEAGGYLAGSPPFQKAITLCRALGMPISASMQVAGYRQMDRATRSQFGNSLAFGVRELIDARFALLDQTLNAGAAPHRWANNHPGRHIAEVTGVPSEEWSMIHRTFKISDEQLQSVIEMARGAGWAKCDPGTFELLSRGIERPQKMIVTGTEWANPMRAEFRQPVEMGPAVVDLDRYRRPEQAPPVISVVKSPEPDDTDAHQLMDGRVEELRASGITEVTAADFEDLVRDLGFDRTWIYKVSGLPRLVKLGKLRRISGKGARYEILPAAGDQQA